MKQKFKVTENKLVPIDSLLPYPEGAILSINLPKNLETKDEVELQRRAEQNRLMWSWLTDLKNTTVNQIAGTTVEEWHRKMRKYFLFPIYVRDSEMWALTAASLDIIKQHGTYAQYDEMWARILDDEGKNRLSTSDANVEQFTEYLDCIERFAHSHGVILRTDRNY